ncbi:hypothetical protein CLV86_2197 [Lacinutrix venerupis]|uniref:hypothetical protein n=1 Tax=Lacinutrix venerupis TaxID=1486034 RepID=UPI000EB3E1B6|nr:hypothetical protein [Lacinutrix venerupis]RLJ62589.1 hypothetical protein CLV86_2197 [Lacinutrix venerupis]
METSTKKGFKALLPGKEFVKGTFNTVSFQKIIQHFINYVQQCGIPSINTNYAKGKVEQKVIDDLNAINISLKTHFNKIQNDAQKELAQVENTNTILGKIWHFSRTGEVSVKAIYTAVKNNPNPLSPETKTKITKYLNLIDKSLADLESSIPADAFDVIHKELNKDISNLNTDFTNMQAAIPDGDGSKLDLTNLTEAEAKSKLDKQINSLNNNISTLQQEIAWETVGQVGIGIVGGLIAITNFWNPIGWAAAAGTAVGEAELAVDKADKITKVATDQTNVFISEAEESILQPYYATKHYATQIKSMVAGLESLSQGIGAIRTYIDASLTDMESFIADLGDLDSLDLDYELISGDFKDLTDCVHTLMGPVFDNETLEDPKWSAMASDGKWAKILEDPDSPFYIKLMKEMNAESQASSTPILNSVA